MRIDPYDEEEPSFFQKHRLIVGFGLLVAIVTGVWLGQGFLSQASHPRHEQRIVMVNLPPPVRATPPPPAPAQSRPADEPKMIAQETVTELESKPDETAKADPSPDDSAGPATSVAGDGTSDGFGLRAGNGLSVGTGKTTSGTGSGSRWGWYASQVQRAISQALESNSTARQADFRVDARIWADRNGRVTRARIAGTTGNPALDNAITNQVLAGLILQEPPPEGMPMPIVLRLTAQHPTMALSGVYP